MYLDQHKQVTIYHRLSYTSWNWWTSYSLGNVDKKYLVFTHWWPMNGMLHACVSLNHLTPLSVSSKNFYIPW